TEDFKLIKVIRGHEGEVRNVRFSVDGSKIISVSSDYTVRVWNVASGKQIQVFQGNRGWMPFADFSPDNVIAVCLRNQTIELCDIQSGKILMKLEPHNHSIYNLNFSSDGKYIISSSFDRTIQLWDIESGKKIKQFEGGAIDISGVQFSSDGQKCLSFTHEAISIWDVQSGKRLRQLKAHSNNITCAKFSPNDEFIVSCSLDTTIRIWYIKSGRQFKKLEGHTNAVNEAKYFPDGQTIVSCSDDHTVRLWDVKTGEELQKLERHSGPHHVLLIKQFEYGSDNTLFLKKLDESSSDKKKQFIKFISVSS
ncbi:G-protein beta WD-40 repeats containing protein, partial [Reticulomyxa filosa]